MKRRISNFTMTFFASISCFSALFTVSLASARSQVVQTTEIVFKGSDAKMSMNLFKFQLKNKIRDLNLSLKFIPTEKEVDFDVRGLKSKEIKRRLMREIRVNHNCGIIKENEPDQINAESGYRECLQHASNAETILALNGKQYPTWMARVISEKKLSVVREEMALEAVNADSDTVSMLTSLAQNVQDEVNFLNPKSSEVSVITNINPAN